MIKKLLREYKREYQNWLSKSIKKLKTPLVFLGIIGLGLPFSLLVAFFLAFNGRVYPNIFACRYSLSGKNYKETGSFLASILEKQSPTSFELTYQGQVFRLNLESLKYPPYETAKKALAQGREGYFWEKAAEIVRLGRQEKNLSLDFQLNQEDFGSQIASVAAALYLPAVEPEIKVTPQGNKKLISVETGENGREVDLRALKTQINQALSCPSKEITLPILVQVIVPKVSAQAAGITRQRAESLLGKNIELRLDKQSWEITDEELISFLDFNGGFNKEKLAQFSDNLAQTVNCEPENATFQFGGGRVEVFQPSKDGIVLNKEEFLDEFIRTLVLLEKGQGNQAMEIPVAKKSAKISTGDANSLGIKDLLGRGTSLFTGSITNRIHNINLASLKLNGALIPPGEEFSFNKTIGDVSAATGYKQAYIIQDGRTILGDGGGVCQVSTTLFRAVLNAGLPITERQPHAYRVSYYEQDIGPGFDATVFLPSPDLKFKNNTPSYLLIQTKVDQVNKKLTFDIYGTSDGRKVEISPVRIWDKQPPPPDLYQDDPTLPAGTIKQVEHKSWGAKVAFDYKIVRGEEVLSEKTFYSVYRPWQAVYLRGTGQ